MNVITVVMFFGGVTLVYSAVKDVSPADVIKSALQGKTPGDTSGDPMAPNGVINMLRPNSRQYQNRNPTHPNSQDPEGTGTFDDWRDFYDRP